MEEPAGLFSLHGKTALVTGASRGIGRAIALGYARAGADVAILARSAGDLEALGVEIRDLGQKSLAVPCDVLQPQEIVDAMATVIADLGELDILVNNAGGPVFNAPFLDIRPEGFVRILELNLMSVVHFCQAVGRHMVDKRSGSIVNVDSIGATHPAPVTTPYCAAKAAVVNLSQALAGHPHVSASTA